MVAKFVFNSTAAVLTIALIAGCNEIGNQAPASLELTERIVDEADLLSASAQANLSARLAKLEKMYGPQFVIVTTSSLDGRQIEEYSIDLARKWSIGHEKRDDGVMLLVAPNEQKVRIEVGYGLEASLSDPFCAKVIKEDILPAFRDTEFEKGILAGSDKLIAKMKMVPTIDLNDNELLTPKEKKIAS